MDQHSHRVGAHTQTASGRVARHRTIRLYVPAAILGLILGFLTTMGGIACCDPGRVTVVYTRPEIGATRSPAEQALASAALTCKCREADGETKLFTGSGVLISDSRVVTAAHVLKCAHGMPDVLVELIDGPREGRILMVDLESDAALVGLSTPARDALPPRIGPRPRKGERVCIVTAIPERDRRCGEVDGWDSLPGDVAQKTETRPGNSGSGVYDAHGRLVGIVVSKYRVGIGGYFTSTASLAWVQ